MIPDLEIFQDIRLSFYLSISIRGAVHMRVRGGVEFVGSENFCEGGSGVAPPHYFAPEG